MHFIDGFARLSATRDVRLIRHDKKEKAMLLQSREGFAGSRNNAKFGRRGWRVGFPIADDSLVKHAIPV